MLTYSNPKESKILMDFDNLMADSFEVSIDRIIPEALISELGTNEYQVFSFCADLEKKYGIRLDQSIQVNNLLINYYDRTVQDFRVVLMPMIMRSFSK